MSDTVSQPFSLGLRIVSDQDYGVLRYALGYAVKPLTHAVEFGVGSGTSTRIIAAHMPVTGFDSEQGLVSDWRPAYPKGSLAFPLPVIANAALVAGWFADTLPLFNWSTVAPLGLIHIDCDVYESTVTVLEHVMPHAVSGCVVVFDEFWGYDDGPGARAEDHEQKAFIEYVAAHDISWDVIGHGGETWAIRIR